ncbi:endo alpha-1,4 polygalactosaminidase [uncultured Jatrophihabitans sp.]|uniref:endo alpha-1,4 polygalactosaminidase n=1 Tax=uncultured Jatrophihabitans sp. TaxID=1610747 RepID=UPI0035CC45C0
MAARADASGRGDAARAGAARGDTARAGAARAGGRVALPPVNARFDYQLGGAYRPPRGVTVVERDRTDPPARGRYSICYVNGFQTQPGELRFWQRRHKSLLLRTAGGRYVHDPGWPDEVLLDTRTAAKRAAIARIVGRWFRGCRAHGYQAVEPDNLDSWTRSRGMLHRRGAVALARLLTASAHRLGLAIAQKNTPQLGRAGRRSIGFDFAIAEECAVYRECGAYTRVYGRHVLEIEYTDNGRAAYRRACAAHGKKMSIILRDRELVPRGHRGYYYKSC